jgi:CRP-like cAMP-binding protein
MVSPELLRRYPFFGPLDDARLKAVAMIAEEETVPAGTILLRENEPAGQLFLLIDGAVDLFGSVADAYRPGEYKEFALGEVNPGEPFGISALIEPHKLTTSARAAKRSRLLRIDAVALRALFEQDLQLAYLLTRQVAKAAMERLNATRIQLAAAWA